MLKNNKKVKQVDNSKNINVNNVNIDNSNNTINNNINLVAFGTEEIDCLSDTIYKKLFEKGFQSILYMIKLVMINFGMKKK
jgi:hypothetical protein